MTQTITVCESCKTETDTETEYCPNCGAEDPWIEEPLYTFDPEEDLPVILPYSRSDYDSPLYKEFCKHVFGEDRRVSPDEVSGPLSDVPEMRELHSKLYYVLSSDYKLEGPFLSRKAAINSEAYQ